MTIEAICVVAGLIAFIVLGLSVVGVKLSPYERSPSLLARAREFFRVSGLVLIGSLSLGIPLIALGYRAAGSVLSGVLFLGGCALSWRFSGLRWPESKMSEDLPQRNDRALGLLAVASIAAVAVTGAIMVWEVTSGDIRRR